MKTNEWKPFPKQAEFLSVPFSIKEAMYGGGVNTAKTETLIVFPLVHRLIENPRFKQVIMRRTFPELKREVLPRAKRLYRPFGGKFNGQDMAFTFPSGAMVFLGHCENEDDVHKYDSMEISVFSPDEICSFTEYQYLYIGFERVRAPIGSGLPAIIRCAGMPGGIGHGWVKHRFVDPNPAGGSVLIGRGGNRRFYVHAIPSDNPYTDPSYLQSLDALPEAERQAKKFGSWDAYLGQVFEEFRDKKYPDEPENALHVIEPFDIPSYWPKIVAMDWGFRAYTWVGFGAISPSKRLYIYRELAWKNTLIEEWAPTVKQWISKENPKIIRVCKSAGQDRGQEHTIQEQIETALGRPVELTHNTPGSRVAGKMLMHEFLRWKPKPIPTKEIPVYDEARAQWILRNKGLVEYKNYLDLFIPQEPESNLPRLQIFNTCPLLIQAIKTCMYEKPREGRAPEDVAEFDGDDPYDGARYLIDIADQYTSEANREFEKIKEAERMAELFEQTKDYNVIFARARAQQFNASNEAKPKFIRRYH